MARIGVAEQPVVGTDVVRAPAAEGGLAEPAGVPLLVLLTADCEQRTAQLLTAMIAAGVSEGSALSNSRVNGTGRPCRVQGALVHVSVLAPGLRLHVTVLAPLSETTPWTSEGWSAPSRRAASDP